ncbi:hypothetical protein [Mesorhizobium retamae]|uniref:Uncharacterized protein n=1 Tax=Mesorhizobium retamae TaxID=2912854 RepID=A0ABS9QF27_9HYPH|nr:hypothetical protein [Mesorhizobium sp. IRAMC:0171]MCG7506032.1 hypothetical protein [Mesorhizobium sp. IRAMC:0171]
MVDPVSRLLTKSNSALSEGLDFPTIWQTVLKRHPYVAGLPIQDKNELGPFLKIPLITGGFLISDARGFHLD